jgi:predicted alpha/beta superfamily hydrolase
MTTPVTLAGTQVHRLRSEAIGQEFELRIGLPIPGPMSDPSAAWRVLYVLDGDLFFGTALETTRLMHQLWGELPPILVVGIGYGATDPADQAELRTRDFTPDRDDRFLAMGKQMNPGRRPLLPPERAMGGADAFLGFLQSTVQPYVAERFPGVGETRSTVFGSSLGGLFAAHTLVTRPEAFGGYVIASPALWWHGESVFDREEAAARERDDLDAAVFLGVGALEENPAIPMLADFRLVTNTHRLAERLRSREYPGLTVTSQEFPDETHTSVVSAVLTRGLRALHRPARRSAPG